MECLHSSWFNVLHFDVLESSDSEADTSLEKINESKISGVTPFFSAEDIKPFATSSTNDQQPSHPKSQSVENNVNFNGWEEKFLLEIFIPSFFVSKLILFGFVCLCS